MQAAAHLRWHERRDDVERTDGRDDGRDESADEPVVAGRVVDWWPARTRKRADDRERQWRSPRPHCDPLEKRAGRLLFARERQAGVDVSPAFDRDERDLLARYKDGRQAEERSPFLDDGRAGSRIREETPPDAADLRPQTVAGDEPSPAIGDEGPRRLPRLVVGPLGRRA